LTLRSPLIHIQPVLQQAFDLILVSWVRMAKTHAELQRVIEKWFVLLEVMVWGFTVSSGLVQLGLRHVYDQR